MGLHSSIPIMPVYLYALYSKKFDKIYIGISNDPQRRLKEHNSRKSKYTSAYVPWEIVFLQEVNDYKEARKLEKYYKSYRGRKKIREYISNNS